LPRHAIVTTILDSMRSSSTPLAAKIPPNLRAKLERRRLHTHSSSERLATAAERREALQNAKKQGVKAHNDAVSFKHIKVGASDDVRYVKSAQRLAAKQIRAQQRRQALVKQRVQKAAEHNAASRYTAMGKARIDQVNAENERLRLIESQLAAEERAEQQRSIRADRAAVQNWRVDLVKRRRQQDLLWQESDESTATADSRSATSSDSEPLLNSSDSESSEVLPGNSALSRKLNIGRDIFLFAFSPEFRRHQHQI